MSVCHTVFACLDFAWCLVIVILNWIRFIVVWVAGYGLQLSLIT